MDQSNPTILYFNKKILKSTNELKNIAKTFKDPFKYNSIYDIDSNNNYEILNKVFESSEESDNEKSEEFLQKMYILNFEERYNFYNKYKNIIDNSDKIKKYYKSKYIQLRPTKQIYKDILKKLLTSSPNDFQEYLSTECFIELPNVYIPIKEGSSELKYCYFIEEIYYTFCQCKSLPIENQKIIKEYKNLKSNINNFNNPKKNIDCENSNYLLIFKKKFSNIKSNENEKNDNIEDSKNRDLFYAKQINKFYNKQILIKPIINKYLSKEFEENRNYFLQNIKNDEDYSRIEFIYEIAINLLLYCINKFPYKIMKQESLKDFYEYFYEITDKKYDFLNIILKKVDGHLYDGEEEIHKIENLKNKNYVIKFKNKKTVNFNPFDYVIQFLNDDLTKNTYEEFANKLNESKNWSIQKCSLTRKIYKLEKTNDLFEKFYDQFMNHNVLRKIYKELESFNGFEYIYDRKELKKQINENIFYLPFPTKFLSGLTPKKYGVILINNNRFYSQFENYEQKIERFTKKLCESAFIIITLIHEFCFHYFRVILYSNNHINLCTPPHPYNNYLIDENYSVEDGGDKGEILLFGRKVTYLYLNGLYHFLSMKLWDKYKLSDYIDFIALGKEFIECNKKSNITLKYLDFVKINEFTEQLNNEIEEDCKFIPEDDEPNNDPNNSLNESTNLSIYFSNGKILSIDYDIKVDDEDGDKEILLP